MIVLALDTCDSRGSLALLRNDEVLQVIAHEETTDYSSWVLPAVERTLTTSGIRMRDVDIYAVASGPGSFTGVRIALTTVKAWSEAYGNPIASFSRLEAIASLASGSTEYVAAFADAHRDQVFGALFRKQGAGLTAMETEMVASPKDFLNWVAQRTGSARVGWISIDPEKLTSAERWQSHASAGETVEVSSTVLAPAIGRLGLTRAREGRLIDALALDAEYVRRPDAEVFWKGKASHGG